MFRLRLIIFILYLVLFNCYLFSKTSRIISESFSATSYTINSQALNTYKLDKVNSPCHATNFFMPLQAINPVSFVIGYDIALAYDKNKVSPTANIIIDDDLINPNYVDYIHSIDQMNGVIYISVFFNINAPANAMFNGMGQILQIEFTKSAFFSIGDSTVVSVLSLNESYANSIVSRTSSNGSCTNFQDTIFTGQLKFWANASPLAYDTLNPNTHLITKISGTNPSCLNVSNTQSRPNLNGHFSYNLKHGASIQMNRDILTSTNVQPVINGADAFLIRRVLINDPTFIPSVYQLMAMDVNLDGVISSGDLSQLNLRSISKQNEFKQAWNYNLQGVSNGQLSKDWLFVDLETLNSNPGYKISSSFPLNDNIGYSKLKVPQVAFCMAIPYINIGTCNLIIPETYLGILLGDVNGNFASASSSHLFRTIYSDKVVLDFSKAIAKDGRVDVPIAINSDSSVHALDFAIELKNTNLTFNTIVNHSSNIEMESYYNADDRFLKFTSYSLDGMELNKTILSLRFDLNGGSFNEADLSSVCVYVNGNQTALKVIGSAFDVANKNVIEIYPNPSNDLVNIYVSEDATLHILDLNGKHVMAKITLRANEILSFNAAELANGIYLIKIDSDNFSSIKKLVIKH